MSNFQYTVRTHPNEIHQVQNTSKSPKGTTKRQYRVHTNTQNGEVPCTNQIKPSIESKPDMYNNKKKQSKPRKKKPKKHPDQKEKSHGVNDQRWDQGKTKCNRIDSVDPKTAKQLTWPEISRTLWKWRVEEREMIGKYKKEEWGKDEGAELAIKKDIEDSWEKEKWELLLYVSVFSFLSLSTQLFSLLRLQFRARERDQSWVGSDWMTVEQQNGKTRRKEKIESRYLREGIRWRWHRPNWALFFLQWLFTILSSLAIAPINWNSWVWNFLGMKIEKTNFDKNPLSKLEESQASFKVFVGVEVYDMKSLCRVLCYSNI